MMFVKQIGSENKLGKPEEENVLDMALTLIKDQGDFYGEGKGEGYFHWENNTNKEQRKDVQCLGCSIDRSPQS